MGLGFKALMCMCNKVFGRRQLFLGDSRLRVVVRIEGWHGGDGVWGSEVHGLGVGLQEM